MMEFERLISFIKENWATILALVVILAPIIWGILHFLFQNRLKELRAQIARVGSRDDAQFAGTSEPNHAEPGLAASRIPKVVIDPQAKSTLDPYTPGDIEERLEEIYTHHSAIFLDDNDYHVIVEVDARANGVVCLTGEKLHLRFLYKYPESEKERAWEKLYRDHLGMLNHRWRRDIRSRLRPETFERFLRDLRSHVDQTDSFVRTFGLRQAPRLEGIWKSFDKLASRTATESATQVDADQLLNSLHVLLDEVKPDTLILGQG